jgi:hypothetical protein
MLYSFLAMLLLLHGMAKAVEIIGETQYTLTCLLPSSVSQALGFQSYTFLKLTQHLTTESIFLEYAIGRDGQIPLSSLIQGFANQPEAVEQYNDWTSSLNLHTRLGVAGVVMGVGMMDWLRGRTDAHILVCRVLDEIRGTNVWVEFRQYLMTFDKDAWQSVARRALERPPLVVTVLDSSIRVELSGSIAYELGATSFQFIKIKHDTPVKYIYDEYIHGIHGQLPSKEFLKVLVKQSREGGINTFEYLAWYSHKLLMLKERINIVLAIKLINRADISLSVVDCVNVIEWAKGSQGLNDFTREVILKKSKEDPEFWKRMIVNFLTQRDLHLKRFYDEVDLPPSIAAVVGRNTYKFLKLGRYTTEEYLIEEYEHGFAGQISLCMNSVSKKSLGAFMKILATYLSKEEFYIWFKNPLMMLEQRVRFDHTLITIGSLIKNVEGISAVDVFRWKRGQESLIIFISTAQIDSFWESPVREYVEEMRSSETRVKQKARPGIKHVKPSPIGVRDCFDDEFLTDVGSVSTIESDDKDMSFLPSHDPEGDGPLMF